MSFWANVAVVVVVAICSLPHLADAHGRVMEPPNRSSLWRLPEYKSQFPEANYDDNQIWCGGIGVQYEENGGKCGPCGDAWNAAKPRENEDGGRFGRAIIARTYQPGQVINIAVELTANHLGHFEFNLCPLTSTEDEECFQKYPLPLADGSGVKYMVPRNTTGFYNATLMLPKDFTCRQCSLRWHYRTANRWNFVTNTTGEIGAGNQEIFRSCSDVTIGTFPPVVPRPPTHPIPPEELKPMQMQTTPAPSSGGSEAPPPSTPPKPPTSPSPVMTVAPPKPPTVATAAPPKPATTARPKPPILVTSTKAPTAAPTTMKPPKTTAGLVTTMATSRPPAPTMPAQKPPTQQPAQFPPATTKPTQKPAHWPPATTRPTQKPSPTKPSTPAQLVTTMATTTMPPMPSAAPTVAPVTKPPSKFPMQKPPSKKPKPSVTQEPAAGSATNGPAARPHPTMKPPVPFPRL